MNAAKWHFDRLFHSVFSLKKKKHPHFYYNLISVHTVKPVVEYHPTNLNLVFTGSM